MNAFADEDVDILRAMLREAGETEIMPRFRKLETGDVTEKKSAIDLVTEADLGAERRITARLLARYPGALVVGEEAAEADGALVGRLADAELAFVVDPVDGTFNFAAGLPVFGTILGVVSRGETIAGLIHDPVFGDTLVGVRGAGARLLKADGAVRVPKVAATRPLADMVGTVSINTIKRGQRARIAANLAKTKMAFAYNCSAYEYWMAVTGKADFIGHFLVMPWDHAAGVLIHAEAGGHTARHDGSPYRPGVTTGGILSAPDRDSWEEIARGILA